MNDKEFRAFLDLYEALSDWKGWSESEIDSDAINDLIDRESEKRGYMNWAHAFNSFVIT